MEQDTLGAAVKAAPDILEDPPAALPDERERRPHRRRRVGTVIAGSQCEDNCADRANEFQLCSDLTDCVSPKTCKSIFVNYPGYGKCE